MKNIPIKELAKIIKARPASPQHAIRNTQYAIRDVSIDSRTTGTGDCFFAIPGNNYDGHNYVSNAFAKGAHCAVVGKNFKKIKFPNKTILKVGNTIEALGNLALEYRRHNSFKVIAITGSVGKTSTRQIIYHVLNQRYRCHQAPKNFNNNIGLPLTLLGADPKDQIVITELGSNHLGEIADLTKIAQPDIAVITNVQPAHLAGFGNLENIAAEKLSIVKGLQPNGTLIINADLVKWLNHQSPITNHKIISFGKTNYCNIQARNITHDTTGSRFIIDDTLIELPLPGPGNVENALAAWVVCSRFDISIDDFACAVKTLHPVPMRAELLRIGTLTVLNDCYNANPASMKNALEILSTLDPTHKRRLVFICGDMAELGNKTRVLHEQLGALIAQSKVRLLLTVGEFTEITAHAAAKATRYNLQTKSFKDTTSACNKLKNFINDYDIVLIKGSRTAGLERTIEKLKELFP